MWGFLLKPWFIAISSGVSAYYLAKKQKVQKKDVRRIKLELIEQQRTIDRLRAELGRERHQRQKLEAKETADGEAENHQTSPEVLPRPPSTECQND